MTLAWDNPQDASITGYRIMRGTDAGSLSTIEANTENAGTEYTDTTVAAETTYHYAVLALSQDGDGAQSAAISVTTPAAPGPAAPTGLTASRVGHDSVTLAWDNPQDGSITGYRVLRGADAGSLSAIEEDTGSAGTEYTDTTVAAETTYHYAVLALSQVGAGAQSTPISVTTPAAPGPAAPTGLTASRVAHDSLTLAWDNPQDANITGYRVPAGRRRRRPVRHRRGHGERRHGVHGHHRGGGDHLPLRGPGPEPGWRRSTVHRHQRHHAGTRSSRSDHRAVLDQQRRRRTDGELGDARP